MKCNACGKTNISMVGSDGNEKMVCDNCGEEILVQYSCELCEDKFGVNEINVFLGHYICGSCRVEDLLTKVEIECVACKTTVQLLNACEIKGKHVCRNCGIKLIREANQDAKAGTGLKKWLLP